MTKITPTTKNHHLLQQSYWLISGYNKHSDMRTIIAPTNFTNASRNAINYAADIATNTGAELILLHVIQMPTAFDVPVTQYEYDAMLEDAERELGNLKKELLLRTENEITISTKAVFSTMALELREIEQKEHPFIIVVGPERETGVGRFLFGSHTFSIAKELPCPVIVVPENALFRHIRRIGLATDLKDIKDIPLEAIRSMVEIFDAGLDIVHVCNSADEKVLCEKAVAEITEKLKEFEPKFHFEMNEDVVKGLNAYAKRNRENLVIVLPKKHSFFNALFHGSKSKKAADTLSAPVMAITA
jgi:nucleotide-binding universal stress UspA family protein